MASLQTEIEAYAFRQLVAHLQSRTDVQNIDVMNLAGFCRNCLSKWYLKGARLNGLAIDYDDACEAVYGEPYGEDRNTAPPQAGRRRRRRGRRQPTRHD